jgi:hypothetical protein
MCSWSSSLLLKVIPQIGQTYICFWLPAGGSPGIGPCGGISGVGEGISGGGGILTSFLGSLGRFLYGTPASVINITNKLTILWDFHKRM